MIKNFEFAYDINFKHKIGKKLKFPELLIYAGEKISHSIWVKNLTRHELVQVHFYCNDKDVTFMPKLINFKIGEVKEVVVVCKPKRTRKNPISTIIKIEGKEKIVTVKRKKTVS